MSYRVSQKRFNFLAFPIAVLLSPVFYLFILAFNFAIGVIMLDYHLPAASALSTYYSFCNDGYIY